MTHIRSALAAALFTFGAAAVASAQSTTPATQAPARAQHQRGPGRHRHGAQALLKGISLSDAEKANLKNVRGKYETQFKTLRQQNKPQMQAMRDARQRGDTATMNALREKNAGTRQQSKQLMQAERADFRSALSPENQTKFDANVQTAKAHVGKRGHKKGVAGAASTAGF
ncbi:MAG TPA: Spy/CpxP family protein refolding chaperone [Gemmatimonadaceae bacterium]